MNGITCVDLISCHYTALIKRYKRQRKKGQADNEDIDLMNKKSNHSVNLTIVPKGPCGSSVDNYLVREASKEEPIIDVVVDIDHTSKLYQTSKEATPPTNF